MFQPAFASMALKCDGSNITLGRRGRGRSARAPRGPSGCGRDAPSSCGGFRGERSTCGSRAALGRLRRCSQAAPRLHEFVIAVLCLPSCSFASLSLPLACRPPAPPPPAAWPYSPWWAPPTSAARAELSSTAWFAEGTGAATSAARAELLFANLFAGSIAASARDCHACRRDRREHNGKRKKAAAS